MTNTSKIWVYLTVLIALLVSVASFMGIFNPTTYSQETANWARQAVGQDIGNILAVPTLLISAYFLSKKSVKAYLIWIGTLLYLIYAYLIYSLFVHFNFLFLVYVAVLGLSSYTVVGGLLEQNMSSLLKPIANKKTKSASILLIVIGVLFGFLWLSEIIPALFSGEPPRNTVIAGLWVNPVHVIDLALVLPGMILTGLLLMKNDLLGQTFAAPWFTFSVLMSASIVFTMILELNTGNGEAIVPLAMVGLILLASSAVLYRYLKELNIK